MATSWRRCVAATMLGPILVVAASAESAFSERTRRMRFYCNTGYTIESCQSELDSLRRVLSTVDAASLGEWTWVLVRSEDWKPILRKVGRDPDSPAFTIIEKRQTFLEEALFVPTAGRSGTLLAKYRLPLSSLLKHAVLHELVHAICGERDEDRTRKYAEQLWRAGVLTCPGVGGIRGSGGGRVGSVKVQHTPEPGHGGAF
jgi:hypothetical protein